ncbi:MAG TPA: ABC transporter substrate-binding protein [Acidimicrobiales bacterium]|nr:ABC transporter substrate-binding protein [Acidimicrobiales bacterium]
MRHRKAAALAAVLVLVLAACGRSDSNKEASSSSSGTGSSSSTSGGNNDLTAVANGGFGDIKNVCSPAPSGTTLTASDKGVTATDIHVGTITDKGFTGRAGLNKEMYDTAVAFSKWCNEHGGIAGRKLVIDDRDAKLTDYNGVILASCDADFSLVGGGAVFDDADNGGRVACGLPNIAGYVVTPKARVADLQVQPFPNPVYKMNVGGLKAANTISPDALKTSSVLTAQLPATVVVRDATVEAIQQLGGTVVDQPIYNANGESNWSPFVLGLKQNNVKFMHMVGEPENLALMEKAMKTEGYYPDAIIETANHYDKKLTEGGGDAIKNTWVGMGYIPFELASTNKATQDYLDVMKQYNPDGKVAELGAQTFSAYLLFAQAATECGANLTRTCMLDNAKKIKSWTGGGLHAETNPGDNVPSPCFLLVKASASGFEYDEAMTKPNQGKYNCSPDNIIDLKNDYGVPKS